MVEAAVVLPMMVVFLGLTMYAYRSYAAKMDQQSGTRTDVMSFASNDCEGNANGVQLSQESTAGALGAQGMGGAGQLGKNLSGGGQAVASRTKNTAKVERAQTVDGRAVSNGSTVRFSRRISSMSEVTCNEKRYEDSWSGVMNQAKSLVSNGIGF